MYKEVRWFLLEKSGMDSFVKGWYTHDASLVFGKSVGANIPDPRKVGSCIITNFSLNGEGAGIDWPLKETEMDLVWTLQAWDEMIGKKLLSKFAGKLLGNVVLEDWKKTITSRKNVEFFLLLPKMFNVSTYNLIPENESSFSVTKIVRRLHR